MSNDSQHVTVRILDKEFHVSCPPEEKESLMASARELDRRMRLVRTSGPTVLGADRLAVMVALNLCHELQQERGKRGGNLPQETLQRLSLSLDEALNET